MLNSSEAVCRARPASLARNGLVQPRSRLCRPRSRAQLADSVALADEGKLPAGEDSLHAEYQRRFDELHQHLSKGATQARCVSPCKPEEWDRIRSPRDISAESHFASAFDSEFISLNLTAWNDERKLREEASAIRQKEEAVAAQVQAEKKLAEAEATLFGDPFPWTEGWTSWLLWLLCHFGARDGTRRYQKSRLMLVAGLSEVGVQHRAAQEAKPEMWWCVLKAVG